MPEILRAEVFVLGTDVEYGERRRPISDVATLREYFGRLWNVHPERVHTEPVDGQPTKLMVYMLSDYS